MYADIAIDVPLFKTFSYKVPAFLVDKIRPGSRVLVPFHRTKTVGLCLGTSPVFDAGKSTISSTDLKEILAADDVPLLDSTYLEWLKRASDYYVSPPGMVWAQAMPGEYLDAECFHPATEYRVKNIILPDYRSPREVSLTSEQGIIVEDVSKHLNAYHPVLIHGVTGSGKTEVYIEIIRRVLESGKSALYLVPEIGLTPQTLARLNAPFVGKLLVNHSGLSGKQRLKQWQNCLNKTPQIMVGTRSALFAPFHDLGVIVVDEEHDTSYKQEDHFRYHARELALLRANLCHIPIVLGSATPSFEAYHLAQGGKIGFFNLPRRVGQSRLPAIEIIDMGKEKSQRKSPLVLSQKIIDAITHHHNAKKQMILFVGQRGHAQNAYCFACEHVQMCPNCDVGLKYHSHGDILKCHYCDFQCAFVTVCGACHKASVATLGFGTQSVEDELRLLVPKLKVVRVDSDTFPSPKKLEDVFTRFHRGEIDLILGTQMLTKGHDFANVSFVGVVGIDAHLGLPDFRAGERSFQTLVQVAGRAGREDTVGHVMVQSYFPAHASLVLATRQDYETFARQELALRESLHYPPFSRLVQLKFVCGHADRLKQFFMEWKGFVGAAGEHLRRQGIVMLGPTEMAVHKLRGKFRHHILLKVPKRLKMSGVVHYFLDDFDRRNHRGIQCLVDVDPVGLM